MKLYRILILTICAYTLISCGGAEERKSVYLEKARVSFEAGDLDKARIELKNVIQIDPKDSDAYFFLGKIFEQQKKYRNAFSHYLKVEALNPDNLKNQAKLGRVYLLLANEPDKAQEKIDFILTKEPDNAEGLLLKAAMLLRNKNKTEAISIVEKVIAREPEHIDGAEFLAVLYMEEGKSAEAIAVLENALKLNLDNEKLNKRLAVILVEIKEYDHAEVIYKNFLERNPNKIISYNNLAAFYNLSNDKVKAEGVLRASVNNAPADVKRKISLVRYLIEVKGADVAIAELKNMISKNNGIGQLRLALAELLYIEGDKESAIGIYNKAIKDFPDEVTGVESRISLAAIYLAKQDYIKAAEIIDDAMSVSPNDPKVNFLKAKLAIRDKNLEQAIISLRIVTKETPENIEAFLILANVYKMEGNDAQFNSTLNSAYDNNKTNAEGLLKLAGYYLNRDINQAEKIIDNYNGIKESDYDGLSMKAAILNKNKAQSEAIKIADTLVEAYPKKPNGYLQSVPYYAQKGDLDKVVSILEKGYSSTTDNRKLLMLLTSLQVGQKKFDVVVKRIKAELTATPNDADLKLLLSKVYLANNDIASAESLLKETIKTNPDFEESYLLLSNIYQSKKDSKSVKSVLLQGVDNVQASISISLKLASIYEFEKDYVKAIDVYRSLYQKNKDNLVVMNNLASMLSDYGDNKNDLEQAKLLADKLKDSNQSVFLDTIGWVYYKTGDYKSAVQYLLQVVEKNPKVNIFNYHLGMAYKMSGDKEQAKIYLEKSLVDSERFKKKDLAKSALKDL